MNHNVKKYEKYKKYLPVLFALVVSFAFVGGTSAAGMQPVIPTLALDAAELQSGLFSGANIILGALGSIVFLLIGIGFGRRILDAIAAFIARAI